MGGEGRGRGGRGGEGGEVVTSVRGSLLSCIN